MLTGMRRIRYNRRALNERGLPEAEQYCYLTTTGRKSGKAHTIEIWFAMEEGSPRLYMLAGGRERSDWVQNIGVDPMVKVRIGSREFRGHGRVVTEPEEEMLARRLVVKKYYGRDRVNSDGWEAESLPVVIEIGS